MAELQVILEHLPSDLEVMVNGRCGGMPALCHVGRIERDHNAKRLRIEANTGNPVWANPPVRWDQPAPEVCLLGRFRRAKELDQRLNEMQAMAVPDPDSGSTVDRAADGEAR